jgi:hypothetical protein
MQNPLEFIDYALSFYGPGGVYDLGATRQEVLEAVFLKLTARPDASLNWCGDSVDREDVRDIMLARRAA